MALGVYLALSFLSGPLIGVWSSRWPSLSRICCRYIIPLLGLVLLTVWGFRSKRHRKLLTAFVVVVGMLSVAYLLLNLLMLMVLFVLVSSAPVLLVVWALRCREDFDRKHVLAFVATACVLFVAQFVLMMWSVVRDGV